MRNKSSVFQLFKMFYASLLSRCIKDGFSERTPIRSSILYNSLFIIGGKNFFSISMEEVNYPMDLVNLRKPKVDLA